jgi:uncharacterized protein YndB with AHSA1/START domain
VADDSARRRRLMTAYDWTQFHVHMYYLAPIDEVFRRFSTASGLSSFYIAHAEHTAPDGTRRGPDESFQAGDAYHWTYLHDYAHGGKIEAVDPDRRVRFTFGDSTIEIRFLVVEEATEVALHQTNCPTEDPDRAWMHLNCRSCWVYFLTNLRSVLGTGIDLRDHAHPEWNNSVSIGWDPKTTPGAAQ